MNRGSYLYRRGNREGSYRFNEAPIHESGKYQRGAGEGEDGRGFNEAPIHESGKSGGATAAPVIH